MHCMCSTTSRVVVSQPVLGIMNPGAGDISTLSPIEQGQPEPLAEV